MTILPASGTVKISSVTPGEPSRGPDEFASGSGESLSFPQVPTDSLHDSGTKSLSTRTSKGRLWRLSLAGIGVVSLAGLAGERAWMSSKESAHAAAWGTLDAPRFRPVTEPTALNEDHAASPSFTRPLGQEVLSSLSQVSERNESLEAVRTALVALHAEVVSMEGAPESTRPGSHLSALLERAEQLNLETGLLLEPQSSPIQAATDRRAEEENQNKEFATRFGDPFVFAQSLAAQALGQPLPDHLSITQVQAHQIDAFGRAYESTGQISVADLPYAQKLRVSLHEIGHLVAQVGEHARFASPFGIGIHSKEVSAREEAAAELFALVAMTYIDDPALAKAMGGISLSAVSDFYHGTDTPDFFNYGCALANAALVRFQDPALAYQFMASTEPLSTLDQELALEGERIAQLGGMDEQVWLSLKNLTESRRLYSEIVSRVRVSLNPDSEQPRAEIPSAADAQTPTPSVAKHP